MTRLEKLKDAMYYCKFEIEMGRTTFGVFLVGFVCRIETMHQLLCFKSKFPNHFAFTLGRYLFMLFWVQFI